MSKQLAVYAASASPMLERWSVNTRSPMEVILTRTGLRDVSLVDFVGCDCDSCMRSNMYLINKNCFSIFSQGEAVETAMQVGIT